MNHQDLSLSFGINLESKNKKTGANPRWCANPFAFQINFANHTKDSCGSGGIYPQDRVSGYSIKQIENSLRNTNSWYEWKEHIREQYPSNPENVYLDELFNNW